MDAYIANVLAGDSDDELDEETLDLEALRKKRASKELDSREVAEVKQPEIHTYQEIVEIVEIIETHQQSDADVSASITASYGIDVLSERV